MGVETIKVNIGADGTGINTAYTNLCRELRYALPPWAKSRREFLDVVGQVEDTCRFKSRVTKPIVIITFAGMAMLAGFAMIKAAAAIVVIIGLIFVVIGGRVLICNLLSNGNGELNRLSTLYAKISEEATALKRRISGDPNNLVELDLDEPDYSLLYKK